MVPLTRTIIYIIVLLSISRCDDSCVMKDEGLFDAITHKKQLIREYLGENEGNQLIQEIEKDPRQYKSSTDQPKSVKELAGLLLKERTRNLDVSNADLHEMIKNLETKIDNCRCIDQDRSWKVVGQLKDLDKLWQEYDPLKYTYGVLYNSVIPHEVIFNHWNKGIRMSTLHSYPMEDDSRKLKFGRAVFTKGLDDTDDKENWYHYYYYVYGNQMRGSNGNANTVKIAVKPL